MFSIFGKLIKVATYLQIKSLISCVKQIWERFKYRRTFLPFRVGKIVKNDTSISIANSKTMFETNKQTNLN
jgi:hypothetical protein